ncbi:MAG: TlpA disulfide reductase family protein [Armatimonadia bacterium]
MKLRYMTIAAAVTLSVVLSGCRQTPPKRVGEQQTPVVPTAQVPPVAGAGQGVGQKAPDFTVMDVDGVSQSLGKYGGKVLVIDFWATYCKPCVKKLREYESIYQMYKAKDVAFLALSMDQSDEVIKGWRQQNDVNFPLARLNDETRKAFFGDMALVSIPQMRIVDQRGVVRYSFGPESTKEEVEAAVKALVEEKR